MVINPIQGIEGVNIPFKGFPTTFYKAQRVIPDYEGSTKPVDGLLVMQRPIPPEGVGNLLDIMA